MFGHIFSNIAHDHAASASIVPGTYTAASTKGTGVSLKTAQKADVVIYLGAWTDGTQTWAIQVSPDTDTDGHYVDAPVADLDPVLPTPLDSSGHLVVADATKDGKVYVIPYTGNAPWIRVVTGDAGGTTGGAGAAFVIAGQLRDVGVSFALDPASNDAYNPGT